MKAFIARLKRRKLVQWALAYVAAAFALLQGVDIVGQQFDWPEVLQRSITLAMVLGFFIALVLAWYHGEKGEQRVSSVELLILAMLLAVGGAVMWRSGSRSALAAPAGTEVAAVAPAPAAAAGEATIPARSIAVLPFENLSADKDNAYFSDGIQDLILTKLSEIDELKVISRTSTRKYASRPDDLKAIGQQLGVATILEGSVQKSGNRVLVNVQLIDARTDSHLWAASYTRTLEDVFGVEGEVAGQIAMALKAKLSPRETRHLATALSADPVANDLYLRAEYFADRGITGGDTAATKQAIGLFRQAIAKAPGFALARARLSYIESWLAFQGASAEGFDIAQLKADARAQAEHAMAMAPDLIEAQLAIGYCHYYGRSDYAAALATFSKVLESHPNEPRAIAATAYLLKRQGRFPESLATLKRALALDPRNSMTAREVGLLYMLNGRYVEAQVAFRHALALSPANNPAQASLSQAILLADGNIAGALAAAQGDAPILQSQRFDLLVYKRDFKAALAVLEAIPEDHYIPGAKALNLADAYHWMGDTARARPLYEKALPLLRAQLQAEADDVEISAQDLDAIAVAELGLGHTAAAFAASNQSQAAANRSRDMILKPLLMLRHAQLFARASRADLAVPPLEQALSAPGISVSYSPAMLRIDPVWDPIRHDKRFEALQQRYGSPPPRVLARSLQ